MRKEGYETKPLVLANTHGLSDPPRTTGTEDAVKAIHRQADINLPFLVGTAFIDHWSKAGANERANSQSFLIGLTQLLGVPPPSHNHDDGYSFEYPVKVPDGTSTRTSLISTAARTSSWNRSSSPHRSWSSPRWRTKCQATFRDGIYSASALTILILAMTIFCTCVAHSQTSIVVPEGL